MNLITLIFFIISPVLVYCETVKTCEPSCFLSATEECLDRSKLITAVLEQNPTIEISYQTIESVIARYPQVTSLDDPVLSYEIAPLSIFKNNVTFGQVIRLSQRFPFPGKLRLQGDIIHAETWAATEEYEWAKVQLALMASTLFDDYYVIERSLDINAHHLALYEKMKQSAELRYEAGSLSQNEIFQAELKQSELEFERIALQTERQNIQAKINNLLHQNPVTPLPSAPKNLSLFMTQVASYEALKAMALEQRPDLASIRHKIYGTESAIRLTKLQYYPDFELMTSYNSMWNMPEHRFMVGISINIPIRMEKRSGAVREAKANLAKLQSEYDKLNDQILLEVRQALNNLMQIQGQIQILEKKLIPTTEQQLSSLTFSYETGKSTLNNLIETLESQRSLELKFHLAVADFYKRLAQLDYALGHIAYQNKGGALCR